MKMWDKLGKFDKFQFKAVKVGNEVYLSIWKEPINTKLKFCVSEDGPILTDIPELYPIILSKEETLSFIRAAISIRYEMSL